MNPFSKFFDSFKKYYNWEKTHVDKGEILTIDQKNKQTVIGGVFLILLAISANYLGVTLTCETQQILNTNPYAKFLIIYCLIFFSLSLSAQANGLAIHPIVTLISSTAVFVFYIFFIRCSIFFILMTFFCLFVILVLQNYVYYYNSSQEIIPKEERERRIKNLLKYIYFIFIFVTVMIVMGFFIHLTRDFKNQYKSFSLFKYLFHYRDCN